VPLSLTDAAQPAAHIDAADDANDRGLHSLAATISEHGRRVEDVMSDLEQSLTALFATQIAALQRLHDQARDHDRRWAEQNANRRASFAPP
jgi:hypothetical protein